METIIGGFILLVILLLLFRLSKKEYVLKHSPEVQQLSKIEENDISDIPPVSTQSFPVGANDFNLLTELESNLAFPDRTDAINFHKGTLISSFEAKDFSQANLSFAKLIESVRQQNKNQNGALDEVLNSLRKLYDLFRNQYNQDYPIEFLPRVKRPIPVQKCVSEDPILAFEGQASPKTPKDFLSHLYTVKKQSEWERIGFKPKRDKTGRFKTITRKGDVYIFKEVSPRDNDKLAVLDSGKRYSRTPYQVFSLFSLGVPFEEFHFVSKDLISFCLAYQSYLKKDFKIAMVEIEKAFTDCPQESLYGDLYFDVKFELKDISVIFDEIDFQIKIYNGVGSMLHSGRAERWLPLIKKAGEPDLAQKFFNSVKEAYQKELASIGPFKKPQGCKLLVNGSEEEGEKLAQTSHNNQIDFLKSKMEKFALKASKILGIRCEY